MCGKMMAVAVFLLMVHYSSAQKSDDYFTDKCLRVDYELVGNHDSEMLVLKQLKELNDWAGAKTVGDTATQLGNYRYSVIDSATNRVLYQRGFSSLFNEWQQTPEAKQTTKSFYHVNLIPFPRNTFKFRLERSNYSVAGFSLIGEFFINPNDKFICKENVSPLKYTVIQGGDNIANKIDIAFLAEGYTLDQMDKFRSDVSRFWNYLSNVEPYASNKNSFNIYAVESPSVESGTDIPNHGVYRNTAMNFTFSTFDVDRYLTTFDMESVHDIASAVPYDHIVILVNTDEYGGGGFYNFYASCTSDHNLSEKVLVHEFGHSFAGLADEYDYSDDANEEMYSLNREPWEPNITSLVDFDSKWKTMIDPTTPIPTPRTDEFKDKVGVFEGGGYQSKGIYSPVQDCIMKTNNPKEFCPVCRQAIERAIRF